LLASAIIERSTSVSRTWLLFFSSVVEYEDDLLSVVVRLLSVVISESVIILISSPKSLISSSKRVMSSKNWKAESVFMFFSIRSYSLLVLGLYLMSLFILNSVDWKAVTNFRLTVCVYWDPLRFVSSGFS